MLRFIFFLEAMVKRSWNENSEKVGILKRVGLLLGDGKTGVWWFVYWVFFIEIQVVYGTGGERRILFYPQHSLPT